MSCNKEHPNVETPADFFIDFRVDRVAGKYRIDIRPSWLTPKSDDERARDYVDAHNALADYLIDHIGAHCVEEIVITTTRDHEAVADWSEFSAYLKQFIAAMEAINNG